MLICSFSDKHKVDTFTFMHQCTQTVNSGKIHKIQNYQYNAIKVRILIIFYHFALDDCIVIIRCNIRALR